MNRRIAGLSALGLVVAIAAAAAIVLPARSQINASPSLVPIGVSASGSGSTVWFHEPSSRQAVACQTVSAQGSGLSGIQCVSTRLP